MRVPGTIVAILAAVWPMASIATAQDDQEVIRSAENAVLFIDTGDKSGSSVKSGSGVVISSDGYALTSYHIVQGHENTLTVHVGGRYRPAIPSVEVYDKDPPHDLALLKLNVKKGQTLPFLRIGNPEWLRKRDPLLLAGFPLGSIEPSVVGGAFDSMRPADTSECRESWLIRLPANPGSSGGPVLNKKGEIVGLLCGADRGVDQYVRMIPISLAYPMLSSTRVEYPYSRAESTTVVPGVSSILQAALASADRAVERAKGVAADANHRRVEAEGWGKAGATARARALQEWDGYKRLTLTGESGPMTYLGGVMRTSAGQVLAHGVGVREQPEGTYSGQFQWNSASGSGVFVDRQNRRMAGIWGHGQFRFGVSQPDPKRPETRQLGRFVATRYGYRLDGYGAMENVKLFGSDVSRIYGEFESGELSGFGVVLFPNGTQWKGEWKHNKLNGVGAQFRKGSSIPYRQGFFVDGNLQSPG